MDDCDFREAWEGGRPELALKALPFRFHRGTAGQEPVTFLSSHGRKVTNAEFQPATVDTSQPVVPNPFVCPVYTGSQTLSAQGWGLST